jgi:hypothetical protein
MMDKRNQLPPPFPYPHLASQTQILSKHLLETNSVSIMRNPLSLVTLSAFLGLTHALDLPIISLPWGKYQAEVFADDDKVRLTWTWE